MASAARDKCQCGHMREMHDGDGDRCDNLFCKCKVFVKRRPPNPPAWVWVIGLAINIAWTWYAWHTDSLLYAFLSGAGVFASLNWLLSEEKIAARQRARE